MTGTNTCDRCGVEYDSYVVLVRDSFHDLVEHAKYQEYNFCKPCRMAVTDHGAYLTESEREELEPKVLTEEQQAIAERLPDDVVPMNEEDREI